MRLVRFQSSDSSYIGSSWLSTGCDAPLGMESKRIKDSQLKVSSFNPSGLTMRASRARLHVFGGWCTKSIENSEWSGRKYFVPKEYLGKYH